LEGSGSPSNCEPPLVKKIHGSVNSVILFYIKSAQKENGVSNSTKQPDLLIVANPSRNGDAIKEARKINIPVISFLNTSLNFRV
jgi:hypothetical protein